MSEVVRKRTKDTILDMGRHGDSSVEYIGNGDRIRVVSLTFVEDSAARLVWK